MWQLPLNFLELFLFWRRRSNNMYLLNIFVAKLVICFLMFCLAMVVAVVWFFVANASASFLNGFYLVCFLVVVVTLALRSSGFWHRIRESLYYFLIALAFYFLIKLSSPNPQTQLLYLAVFFFLATRNVNMDFSVYLTLSCAAILVYQRLVLLCVKSTSDELGVNCFSSLGSNPYYFELFLAKEVFWWVLGAFLTSIAILALWNYYSKRFQEHIKENRRSKERSGENQEALIQFYEMDDRQCVYTAKMFNSFVEVPFLTRPMWNSLDFHTRARLIPDFGFPTLQENPVDDLYVRLLRWFGTKLTDNWLYSLTSIEANDSEIMFRFNLATYFQFVSANMFLGEDDERTLWQLLFGRLHRRRYANNLEQIHGFGPQAGGVHCVTIVTSDDETKGPILILHERAKGTVSYNGSVGVSPMFAFQPLQVFPKPMQGEDYRERIEEELEDTLTRQSIEDQLNFRTLVLRELAEEFFDGEKIINENVQPMQEHDWFLQKDAPKEIRDQFEHVIRLKDNPEHLDIQNLGFGYDARSAEPIFALLAIIRDKEFRERGLREMQSNWEQSRLHLIDLNNMDHRNKLENWLEGARFHPASAFALSKALGFLVSHGYECGVRIEGFPPFKNIARMWA